MRIDEICTYAPKSGIKAGEETKDGQYMFFTSSEDESKRYTDYQYDGEGIIMGTGGNATLHYYHGKYAVSTDCIVLNPDDRVRCKYLYYFFLANMPILEAGFKGAGLKHTNKKYIGSITIPKIPSYDEQDRVIEILDNISGIIYARNLEIAKFDNLIKARFVEMFGEPQKNPFKFRMARLKDTCEVITGNTPPRSVKKYYGDFIEWIKTDNIVSGLINPTTASECLSEAGMHAGRTVDENVILMACIAGSVASIGRVCVTNRKVAFNQQINAIVPRDYNVLFLYVMLTIAKPYLVENLNMALKGILSKSKLEEKSFIVPPLDLQNEFASFAQQVEKSKAAVQKSLDETQLLFESLLQKYFE